MSPDLSPVANHLWQSSLFAIAIAITCRLLKKNRAAVRGWLWTAASVKFLIPFSLLVSFGGYLSWSPPVVLLEAPVSAVVQISQPFESHVEVGNASGNSRDATVGETVGIAILTLWTVGFGFCVIAWSRRWWRIRSIIQSGTRIDLGLQLPTLSIDGGLEPGVFGVFRPILVLPNDITTKLTASQLATIVSHELCHVRRADNLRAATHMFVEALFWFHPLVWWMERRIIEGLENACDEDVLRRGSDPETYAAAILRVCELYVASPLAAVTGATGSDLKKRIRAIMSADSPHRLGYLKMMLLASIAVVSIAMPFAIGAAQAAFEAATVKPSPPGTTRAAGGIGSRISPGGRFFANNNSLKDLIETAYELKGFQVIGGPKWMDPDMMTTTDRYIVEATAGKAATRSEVQQLLQTLLAERFKLKFHWESREFQIYELVAGKSGHRLGSDKGGTAQDATLSSGQGHIRAKKMSMSEFANGLSQFTGRMVVDKTGIAGRFDFNLDYTPEAFRTGSLTAADVPRVPGETPADPNGPSLFTALQDQLRLRLEATRGPLKVLVVDDAQRPESPH